MCVGGEVGERLSEEGGGGTVVCVEGEVGRVCQRRGGGELSCVLRERWGRVCQRRGGGTVVCVEGEVGESLSEEGGGNCRVCRGRGGGESVRGGGDCRVCRGRGGGGSVRGGRREVMTTVPVPRYTLTPGSGAIVVRQIVCWNVPLPKLLTRQWKRRYISYGWFPYVFFSVFWSKILKIMDMF